MDSYISSTEQNNHTTQCTKQIPIKYLKACRSLHNTLSFYLYMHVKYCALEQDRTCVQSSSTWNGFRMGQLPIQRPTLSQTNSSWEMLYIIHVAIYHGPSWWSYKLMYSTNNSSSTNINLNRINRPNNPRTWFSYGSMMTIKRGIFRRFLNTTVFKYMTYIEM